MTDSQQFMITKTSPNELLISVKGDLDESSKTPDLPDNEENSLIKAISIDLNDLTYLNSAGIRLWLKTSAQISKCFPNAEISIHNCPYFFISQTAFLSNMIPESATVKSLYLNYFDEKTNETKTVKYTPSKTVFESIHEILNEIPKPDERTETMTLDALPEKFFRFLVKK